MGHGHTYIKFEKAKLFRYGGSSITFPHAEDHSHSLLSVDQLICYRKTAASAPFAAAGARPSATWADLVTG